MKREREEDLRCYVLSFQIKRENVALVYTNTNSPRALAYQDSYHWNAWELRGTRPNCYSSSYSGLRHLSYSELANKPVTVNLKVLI